MDSDHGRQLKEAERVNAYSLSNVYKSFGLLDDARDPPTWQLSDHLKVQFLTFRNLSLATGCQGVFQASRTLSGTYVFGVSEV